MIIAGLDPAMTGAARLRAAIRHIGLPARIIPRRRRHGTGPLCVKCGRDLADGIAPRDRVPFARPGPS